MPIKLVVFDVAGTTVYDDNNVAETLQNAMLEHDLSVSIDEINVVMGYPKPEAIKILLRSFPQVDGRDGLAVRIHDSFVDKMISFYRNYPGVREKEGVSDTFRILKEHNVMVGIDTGFSRNIADVILERMGWLNAQLIDYSVTSDEVANGRPFPDMIYKAMEGVGVSNSAEVAKVGDTISDLQEGTSAGCKFVIGVTTGSYSKEELAITHHTHLIENIREVLDIILPGVPGYKAN